MRICKRRRCMSAPIRPRSWTPSEPSCHPRYVVASLRCQIAWATGGWKSPKNRAILSSPMMRASWSVGHRLTSGRTTVMADAVEQYDALIRSGARRLTRYQRRSFQAEVATALCGGNARQAEYRFGWGRETVEKGLHEQNHSVRCLENFAARGRRRSEEKDPRLAADIRAIVEPHTYADPELKSARRYTNLSAAEVREALITKGYSEEALPSERTMRDILNRMSYRLKRIQKGKPLKKTKETDANFANVRQVKGQVRDDPETLEISVDTKAKVALGDYARGGKNPDRQRR